MTIHWRTSAIPGPCSNIHDTTWTRRSIRVVVSRWRLTTHAIRRRGVLEVSRWTRGTLIALIGFGCVLMSMGGLVTYGIARVGYDRLERLGLLADNGGYGEIVGIWIFVLILLFGGDFARGIGWFELRRRRIDAAPLHARNSVVRAAVTPAVLSLLVAPVMLFWGVIGLISIFNWIEAYFIGRPASGWVWTLRSINRSAVLNVCMWWLVSVALLAGGVAQLWLGIRSLVRRRESNP